MFKGKLNFLVRSTCRGNKSKMDDGGFICCYDCWCLAAEAAASRRVIVIEVVVAAVVYLVLGYSWKFCKDPC